MKKRLLYSVFISGALLLLAACGGEGEEEDGPLSEEEQESVEVRQEVVFATADSQPLASYVESDGVVEASNRLVIKPRISGYIEGVNLREGQWVQEGDTLLKFDDEEWRYDVQEAQNKYNEALSAYQIEKRQREELNNDALGINGNDTTRKSDRMVRIATGLAQAEVALERAKMNLTYATITAPFAGTIAINANQRISEGSYVGAGTELGQLVHDVIVRVRFDVLESELSKVKEGMAVEVTAPDGQTMNGTVAAVSPVVDTKSKTGEIIARLDNSRQLLRPGMTVEGRIVVQRQTAKARIPREAILSRDGGRTLVFKLNNENNEVEWVYVTPIAQNNEWALVDHEDIEPGDTLAVGNHFSLSHLQIVSPKMQGLQREDDTDQEL